jgi:citrate lyase subunit beta/citryl-CoA lyase
LRDSQNESIKIARQTLVFAARSVGAIPIDTPHINVHDMEGLELHVSQARELGFGGMQILHPKEIAVCTNITPHRMKKQMKLTKL